MARSARTRSAASRVFLALLAAAVLVGALAAVGLALESQRATRIEAEHLTSTLAQSLAASPTVIEALEASDPDAAGAALQSYTSTALGGTLDFITVMTPDGIRVTHPDPAQIGEHYLGTIPAEPGVLTEQFVGTLGPSVRTIVPVQDAGALLGWVSVGVTVESMGESFIGRLPSALAIAAVIIGAGLLGAFLARRVTRSIAGDLPPGAVRDAISSYESVRTLGEALRAQTHEHGNRMHTAIALLELGRAPEAIEILAETSRQSQDLVDQVTARRAGDPTVGALLLGKASQAKERGVEWDVRIDPDAPMSPLSPVDSVSVLGNLIDNALDAAAAASGDRWVRVVISAADDGVAVAVSDSGAGVPTALRERVFQHGFSTKPAGVDGRGVGLALVRSLVTEAGGTVRIDDAPTTFTVRLPAAQEVR